MAFSDWSTTDSENDTSAGINIAEGCPAANVNNWGRRIMAQLRSAFNPILDTFFASTTLAQARTALGVPEGSTSVTNFGALTNAANQVPLMTGSDAWTTFTATAFGRSVAATGDATALLTLLGAPGAVVTTDANGTAIALAISGTTYYLQSGTVTVSGAGNTSVTFTEAFSGTPVVVCSGGSTSSGSDANDRITAVTSSGATITSSYGTSHTSRWIAIGS